MENLIDLSSDCEDELSAGHCNSTLESLRGLCIELPPTSRADLHHEPEVDLCQDFSQLQVQKSDVKNTFKDNPIEPRNLQTTDLEKQVEANNNETHTSVPENKFELIDFETTSQEIPETKFQEPVCKYFDQPFIANNDRLESDLQETAAPGHNNDTLIGGPENELQTTVDESQFNIPETGLQATINNESHSSIIVEDEVKVTEGFSKHGTPQEPAIAVICDKTLNAQTDVGSFINVHEDNFIEITSKDNAVKVGHLPVESRTDLLVLASEGVVVKAITKDSAEQQITSNHVLSVKHREAASSPSLPLSVADSSDAGFFEADSVDASDQKDVVVPILDCTGTSDEQMTTKVSEEKIAERTTALFNKSIKESFAEKDTGRQDKQSKDKSWKPQSENKTQNFQFEILIENPRHVDEQLHIGGRGGRNNLGRGCVGDTRASSRSGPSATTQLKPLYKATSFHMLVDSNCVARFELRNKSFKQVTAMVNKYCEKAWIHLHRGDEELSYINFSKYIRLCIEANKQKIPIVATDISDCREQLAKLAESLKRRYTQKEQMDIITAKAALADIEGSYVVGSEEYDPPAMDPQKLIKQLEIVKLPPQFLQQTNALTCQHHVHAMDPLPLQPQSLCTPALNSRQLCIQKLSKKQKKMSRQASGQVTQQDDSDKERPTHEKSQSAVEEVKPSRAKQDGSKTHYYKKNKSSSNSNSSDHQSIVRDIAYSSSDSSDHQSIVRDIAYSSSDSSDHQSIIRDIAYSSSDSSDQNDSDDKNAKRYPSFWRNVTRVTNIVKSKKIPLPLDDDDNIIKGVEGTPWVVAKEGEVPSNAVVGGENQQGNIYVARLLSKGCTLPGKLIPDYKKCFTSLNKVQITSATYEVLCDQDCEWVTITKEANFPKAAILGGYNTQTKTPLYIGKVQQSLGSIVGQVDRKSMKCFVVFGGKEHEYHKFQLLVSIKPEQRVALTPEFLKNYSGAAACQGRLDDVVTGFGTERPVEKKPEFKLTSLHQISADYLRIKNMMQTTINTHVGRTPFKSYNIISIEKVWNTKLYRRFNMQKLTIKEENNNDANIRELFHGSSQCKLIAEKGFDERHSKPGMFGAGLYFADQSSKSHGYASTSPPHMILLCEVALGKAMKHTTAMKNYSHAPPGYHSVEGVPTPGVLAYHEFIVYRGDQAFPKYLITYSVQ